MVRLRKVHPCGGTDWQVYRLGADIGLRCLTCGRRVMLGRAVLEKRIKVFVSRGERNREGDPHPSPLFGGEGTEPASPPPRERHHV